MAEKKPLATPAEKDTGAPEAELTVQEHIERLELAPWQVTAVLARYYATGMTRSTRMPAEKFDAAVQVALHGRV